jgi:hypothetical protein
MISKKNLSAFWIKIKQGKKIIRSKAMKGILFATTDCAKLDF